MQAGKEFKLIHIFWDGPKTLKEVEAAHAVNDRGIYQIYGPHDVFGADTLLYIGQTTSTFAARVKGHKEWLGWLPAEAKVYLGRLAGTEPITDEEWNGLIDRAEALLIWKIRVPVNSSRISRFKYTREWLLIINHGDRHRLPESISTTTNFFYTGLPGFKSFPLARSSDDTPRSAPGPAGERK